MEKATEMGSILGYLLCTRESTSWIFLVPKRRHHLKLGKRPRGIAALVLRNRQSGSAGSEDVKQEVRTYEVTKRSLTQKLSISGQGKRKCRILMAGPQIRQATATRKIKWGSAPLDICFYCS